MAHNPMGMATAETSTTGHGNRSSVFKSVYNFEQYDARYYGMSFLAGAAGTCITHTAMTPLDVVKTKIQLEPERYPWNPIATARMLAKESVPLFTGGVPTALGYLGQGAGKFGGVEVLKIQMAKLLGDEVAYKNRIACTLVASAIAETVVDIAWLCPFEAIRIKQVNNPGLSMAQTARLAVGKEGVLSAFYSGLGPILAKQIPYTMAKFAVQDVLREKMCPLFGINNLTEVNQSSILQQVGLAFSSGFGAGVAAALVSHPADTLLTLMNKTNADGLRAGAGLVERGAFFVRQRGVANICSCGIATRFLHVGLLTAGQFIVFDVGLASVGFSKFHFVDPENPH